ncbi:MAG: HD domain-containing protein [Clostridiales bacterium]|jgi:predicted HD superfamily hydrolase involved in NAD metabolism|nr:bis(5'-nucleosyl)-tetraphosphatase (symmetrical) YqeK [Bacillota bacterium]NLK02958.1 HD domain-containing protein [Clostridiales bacterium]
MEIEQLRKYMKAILSEKRYNHSLGVEEVAYDLGLIHGVDTMKASIGGILHDCAKYLTESELLSEATKYNIDISEAEVKSPQLLHAKLGGEYAREKYGIDDQDIINSIKYHTTGRPSMSTLEKIVYIADFIEPNRKPIPILDKARELAYNDLNEAIIYISYYTLQHLKDKGRIIDPLSEETYKYYVNNRKF